MDECAVSRVYPVRIGPGGPQWAGLKRYISAARQQEELEAEERSDRPESVRKKQYGFRLGKLGVRLTTEVRTEDDAQESRDQGGAFHAKDGFDRLLEIAALRQRMVQRADQEFEHDDSDALRKVAVQAYEQAAKRGTIEHPTDKPRTFDDEV